MSVSGSLDAVMEMTATALGPPSTFATLCPTVGSGIVSQGAGATGPYAVVLCREYPGDLETFSRLMFHVEQRVRIFSRATGTAEMDAIANAAIDALHHASVSLSGWAVHLIHYVTSLAPVQTLVDSVNWLSRDVVFEWLVEPTS